jgi:hypothetical protein
MRLTGGQHKQLQQALLSAFPTHGALAQMVRHQLDQDLEQIAGSDKLDDIVFSLINWAEAGGRIEELIEKTHNENPGNPDLKVFFEQFQQTQRELGADLESPILGALHEYHNSHADSPGMTLGELYNAIGVSPNDSKKVGLAHRDLFSLKNKGRVKSQILADGSSIVTITPEGMRVAQGQWQPASPVQQPETPAPSTLDDLIRGQDCAYLVQRDDVLREIIGCFTRTSDRQHFIVLHGESMVEKTKILERIAETLSAEYVPLLITGQGLGLSAVKSLDDFLFDLADQLTNRFRDWTKNQGGAITLDSPDRSGFQGGQAQRALYKHWEHLRHNAGERPPIVMFDEIEHLLDQPDKLNPQVLIFLEDLVRKPENGYFIMAGSEQIQHSSHTQFSGMIARGYPIRVRYYDEATVLSVFTIFQKYFTVDKDALRCLCALCDGHPRFLRAIYQAVRSLGKQKLEKSDIEPVLTKVVEQTDDILWLLLLRLSHDERIIVWLISQVMPDFLDRLVYSLHKLLNLAGEIYSGPSVNYKSLSRGVSHLETRQWVQWENRREGLFRFRLGIVPFWVRFKDISPDEVRPS